MWEDSDHGLKTLGKLWHLRMMSQMSEQEVSVHKSVMLIAALQYPVPLYIQMKLKWVTLNCIVFYSAVHFPLI
jgi:hypothetical protein